MRLQTLGYFQWVHKRPGQPYFRLTGTRLRSAVVDLWFKFSIDLTSNLAARSGTGTIGSIDNLRDRYAGRDESDSDDKDNPSDFLSDRLEHLKPPHG